MANILPDTATRNGQLKASELLLNLMEWETFRPYYSPIGRIEFTSIRVDRDYKLFSEVGDTLAFRGEANFYHQDNMSLAWRVLNWAQRTLDRGARRDLSYIVMDFTLSPTEAQRQWLDKVLDSCDDRAIDLT